MPPHQLTGTRVRARRLDQGMLQSELAAAVGISASYLNLIEHNRRNIGGKLLLDLARALSIEPIALSEGPNASLVEKLRVAVAQTEGNGNDLLRSDELTLTFPDWAQFIVAQRRRIEELEARVNGLTERLAHDPRLASSLYQVLSTATSIHSAASILVGDAGLDRDWQRRFHQNIYDDAMRLAESSRALVDYLEDPEEGNGHELSTQDEVARFLDADGCDVETSSIDDILARSGLVRATSIALLRGWLETSKQDASLLPMRVFEPQARALSYRPIELARHFNVGLPVVLRRLAGLPKASGHPPVGLVICDAAAGVTHLQTVAGFDLPHAGAACPLWPLYLALGQPGRPVAAEVRLPGERPARFACYAIAEPRGATALDAQPVLQSTMLVVPDAANAGLVVTEAGPGCRICPRAECGARREPSILATY